MLQINGCLHTALLVSDIHRAEQFYSQILQLQKVDRPFDYAGVWYQIGSYQLHLIEDPHFCYQLQNPEKIGRNPHIAFGVAAIAPVQSQLEQQGYPYQRSASGRAALFIQDPDGNVIEISEQPPLS